MHASASPSSILDVWISRPGLSIRIAKRPVFLSDDICLQSICKTDNPIPIVRAFALEGGNFLKDNCKCGPSFWLRGRSCALSEAGSGQFAEILLPHRILFDFMVWSPRLRRMNNLTSLETACMILHFRLGEKRWMEPDKLNLILEERLVPSQVCNCFS